MTFDTRYFALAVRVLGLFVLAEAVPSAIYYVLNAVAMYQQMRQPPGSTWDDMLWGQGPTILFMTLRLALGVYLLRGGGAVARYCVRVCEFSCPACGHDLRSVTADVCPECGCVNVLAADLSRRRAATNAAGDGPTPSAS